MLLETLKTSTGEGIPAEGTKNSACHDIPLYHGLSVASFSFYG